MNVWEIINFSSHCTNDVIAISIFVFQRFFQVYQRLYRFNRVLSKNVKNFKNYQFLTSCTNANKSIFAQYIFLRCSTIHRNRLIILIVSQQHVFTISKNNQFFSSLHKRIWASFVLFCIFSRYVLWYCFFSNFSIHRVKLFFRSNIRSNFFTFSFFFKKLFVLV